MSKSNDHEIKSLDVKSGASIVDVKIIPSEESGRWNNSIEFLMSCIALSVGFGNIWRFPFTAYENGGGVFLIPYVILLFLVGKPLYYLEMIIGQFSGRSSTKVWSLAPGLAGVGWAQMFSTICLASYYCSLMALTLFYLIASFAVELPWARCNIEWGEQCVDSGKSRNVGVKSIMNTTNTSSIHKRINNSILTDSWRPNDYKTSAQLYFSHTVLKEKTSIEDGIGFPDWRLTLCLLGSWICVCLVLSRGVKSTGKASYFLAIFPYIVLISLLIRAVTLDGAMNGIIFFIKPDWEKLFDPAIWFAAVTQCFFSLSVCFGAIITYSSHNNFHHNIYRDVMIITSLDTVTSLIAGCTIFGILGNLAFELETDDIKSVVRAGTGLAFISYPDAIAKFSFVPQLFAVLFFVMMFVLGVGSAVGMTGGIIAGISDQFPGVKHWQIAYPTCFIGFLIGLIYVTPGGQFILTLVDYYGTSFVVFILASFEVIGVVWIYGFENFLDDIEFMIGRNPSVYWKLCWFLITPIVLIVILVYTIFTLTPLTYANTSYPLAAQIAGIILLAFGVLQIPTWAILAMKKNKDVSVLDMIKNAFKPSSDWGPRSPHDRRAWLNFKEEKLKIRNLRTESQWIQVLHVLFNKKKSE